MSLISPSRATRRRLAVCAAVAAPLTLLVLASFGGGLSESESRPQVVPTRAEWEPRPVVSIVQGADYGKTTLAAIDSAGGLGDLVKKGSTVFIKVNIVNAGPSGTGKITDWRVVQAVVSECRRLGAAVVRVGETPNDGTGMGGFRAAGYGALKGAELVATDVPRDQCRLVIPEKSMLGQGMYLPKLYLDADVVIDIPVMKIHCAAGVTVGLKNVGIGVPPQGIYAGRGAKWGLHDLGMNKVITEVSLLRRPDFVVIDGMVAGEGEGPNNPTPLRMNLVLASRDIVAIDTVGSAIMGVNPEQVGSIQYAAAQGIGVADLASIRVVGKSIGEVRRSFARPTNYGHPFKRTTTVRATSNGGVTIDGSLAEWSGAWENRVGDVSQYLRDGKAIAPGKPAATASAPQVDWRDCSARTMVMHDLANLYFAFKVRDDEVMVGPDGDMVEFLASFDMPFIEEEAKNLKIRTKHVAGKDFILTAAYSDTGEAQTLVDRDTGKSVSGTQVVFAKTPDGYVAEGIVPLSSLGRRPLQEREEIWLDFAVDDVDDSGAASGSGSSANADPSRLKAMWNDVNLGQQYQRPATLGRAFVDPLPPAKSVDPFIAKVESTQVAPGQVALTWIGQSGYILRGGGSSIYIDPYLSDSCGEENRIYPLPVQPTAVTNASAVFITHPHDDHYDVLTTPLIMEASPAAVLVLQERLKVIEAGTLSPSALARTQALRVGQSLTLGGVTATALSARHEKAVDPEQGYENLGYIFDMGGVVVYHTGDSLYWPGMADGARAVLGGRRLDILLVPINGKWGNMTYRDAAKLARDLGPSLVIPIHYGTLSVNTVDPALFVKELRALAPDQAVRVMEPNTPFLYAR